MVFALEMGWRHLLFANWPIDPDLVAAHIPESLTVDTYDGEAWLSVVPFTNVDVRPKGLPRSAGFDLPELNLRTYVTREGEPGVYFFSLDAQGVLGVLGARLFHHLPYYYARMSLRESDGRIRFESRRLHPGDRPARFVATYGSTGEFREPERGSLADFLTDRLRFYTEAQDGTLRYSDISHGRWRLAPAEAVIEENTLFRADGFARPEGDPVLHYSRGMDVIASRSKRWNS